MSDTVRFYCAVSADALAQLSPWGFSPALLAYRLSAQTGLLRTGAPFPLQGGLLTLSPGKELFEGDPRWLTQQIIRECRGRGASGLLADWEQVTPGLSQLTRLLGSQLPQYGLRLFVPEEYGPASERSQVLISSALSGGTLEVRLREALKKWGPDRAVLALERIREDFILPCLSGKGRSLSEPDLRNFIQRNRPGIYWSEEFCARYFTYREGNRVHFVLFDDDTSLVKKLELALRVGFRTAIAPWQEVASCAPEIKRVLHTSAGRQSGQ